MHYKYYGDDKYNSLNIKEQKDIDNKFKQQNLLQDDDNYLDIIQFGINPIQIYNNKSLKEIYKKSDYFENIKLFNMENFKLEHNSFDNINLFECFKCNSVDIINGLYYHIIEKNKKYNDKEFTKKLNQYKKEFLKMLKQEDIFVKDSSVCLKEII